MIEVTLVPEKLASNLVILTFVLHFMFYPGSNPVPEPDPETECVTVPVPAPLRQKDAVPFPLPAPVLQHCLRICSGFLNPRKLQHSKIDLECDWEGTGGGGLSGLEILRRSAELFLECDLLQDRKEKNQLTKMLRERERPIG
jgi:hypothetical protein